MLNIDWSDDLCTITLHDPIGHNTLHYDACHTFWMAIEKAQQSDHIKAVILHSIGDVFCSGYQLKNRLTENFNDQHPFIILLKKLHNFTKLFVVIIDGHVIGDGASFLCHADYIIAQENVTLSLPEITLGLIPQYGTLYFLKEKIGISIVQKMIFAQEEILLSELYPYFIHSICATKEDLVQEKEHFINAIQTLPLYNILIHKEMLKSEYQLSAQAIQKDMQIFSSLVKTKQTQDCIIEYLRSNKSE